MAIDKNTDLTVYDSTGANAIVVGSHVQWQLTDPKTGQLIAPVYTGRVYQMHQKHDHRYVRCEIKLDNGGPDQSRHNTKLTVIA